MLFPKGGKKEKLYTIYKSILTHLEKLGNMQKYVGVGGGVINIKQSHNYVLYPLENFFFRKTVAACSPFLLKHPWNLLQVDKEKLLW